MSEAYKSRVYTDRPDYADYDPPAKFEAIISIIAKRLVQHPKAICSYSGGADSDIMIDLIERTRILFCLRSSDGKRKQKRKEKKSQNRWATLILRRIKMPSQNQGRKKKYKIVYSYIVARKGGNVESEQGSYVFK